jgi:hypothetical protein
MRGIGQKSGCVAVPLVKHPGSGDVKRLHATDSHAQAADAVPGARARLIASRLMLRTPASARTTRVRRRDAKPAVSRNLITQ